MASNFFVMVCPHRAEPFDKSFGEDIAAAVAWMRTQPLSSDLELMQEQPDDGEDGPCWLFAALPGVTVDEALAKHPTLAASLAA